MANRETTVKKSEIPKNERCRLLNQTSEKNFKETVNRMTDEEILSDPCIVFLLHKCTFVKD